MVDVDVDVDADGDVCVDGDVYVDVYVEGGNGETDDVFIYRLADIIDYTHHML